MAVEARSRRDSTEPLLLTTDQLADLLQVPAWTVRKWRSEGTGPKGIRVGRHVRYPRPDVDRWLSTRPQAL